MAARNDPPENHETPEQREESRRQIIRNIGLFSVIIAELVGSCGVGVALGYLAWKHADFPGWTIAVTAAFGLAVGFYRIYQISKKEWGA